MGAGPSSMPNIRIGDLSDRYLRLVDAACLGDNPMTWVEEVIIPLRMVRTIGAGQQKLLQWLAHRQKFCTPGRGRHDSRAGI